MKQFFPAKSVDHEESSVHYNSSEINCLRSREATTVLQSQSAGTFPSLHLFQQMLPISKERWLFVLEKAWKTSLSLELTWVFF